MGLSCSCNQRNENETTGEILSIHPEPQRHHIKNAPSSDQASISSFSDISKFLCKSFHIDRTALPSNLQDIQNQPQQHVLSIIQEGNNEINTITDNKQPPFNPNNEPSQSAIGDTIYNTYNYGHNVNQNNDNIEVSNKQELEIKNDNTPTNKHNKLNPNTIKLFKNNSNIPNLSNATLLNNISYLNECFVSNSIENENINEGWRQLQITNLLSSDKLHSDNPNEIMYRGVLNKLIISHMFKNCSTSVDKFLILTKDTISMYKNKENFLLNYKPQHSCNLKEIVNCKRIDFSFLKIQKLEGFYFMFIELYRKHNVKEEHEDLIFNIIKREKEGKFFVLFSQNEQIINEWIYAINYFKECCLLSSSINKNK